MDLARTLVPLALLAISASYAQGCPESCIRLPNVGVSCSPMAVRDTTLTTVQSGHLCTDWFEARYDIPQATLFLTSGSPFGGCNPEITVEDDFVVHGLPDGTPVSFTARFEVTADYYCVLGSGAVSASVRAADGVPAALSWSLTQNECKGDGNNTRSGILTVPVNAIAGDPFRMRFVLGGEMGELFGEEVSGTFAFDGLPNGTTLVSCNGFAFGPVPALPASWGSLKARYR
jgi:hypothetical protein